MSRPAEDGVHLARCLEEVVAGRTGDASALARLLVADRDVRSLRGRLEHAAAGTDAGAAPAVRILALLDRHERAIVRGLTLIAADTSGNVDLAATRAFFDAAASEMPDVACAFHALGDQALLDGITGDIFGALRSRRLIRPDARVLDLGCGTGRMEAALAAYVGRILGTDLSPGMIEIARTRCRDLCNVTFEVVPGTGLDDFGQAPFDLALAVDVLPYLHRQGGDAALDRIVAEIAGALAPGGTLLALNLTYRGDDAADRALASGLARRHGLVASELGIRPFTTWDGALFRLDKPGR